MLNLVCTWMINPPCSPPPRAVASHPVEQYTEPSTVCVFAGTYNVNGRAPASNLDLHPWLHDAADADVVVIGFQVGA